MDHYKIIVSEKYHNDLRNIISYVSGDLDSPYTAEHLLDKIEASVEGLSTFPYRFPLINDPYLRYRGFRKCIVKRYIIFYQIIEDEKLVYIHRILHSRQSLLNII